MKKKHCLLKYSSIILTCLLINSCVSIKKEININATQLNAFNLQRLIDSGVRTINIGSGTVIIDRTIGLKSNIEIIGSENTVFKYDQSKKMHLFSSGNKKNITIRNLKIESTNKKYLKNHNQGYYVFKLHNIDNLVFDNVEIKNNLNTCIALYDCTNVLINDCSFMNIGTSTIKRNYSYDAIFIGGYNSGSKNIIIDNCSFLNIGEENNSKTFLNDGDGVHIQSTKASINQIEILNCTFESVGRRGVKVQTGSNIDIHSNKFYNCKVGVSITMAKSTNDIYFEDNELLDCGAGFHTNCYVETPFSLTNFSISNNKFINVNGVIRTSGSSKLISGKINNNIATNLESYFFEGVIENGEIVNNSISDFQVMSTKNSAAAVYLWSSSSNNIISKNIFKTKRKGSFDIYLYGNTENNTLSENISFVEKNKRKMVIRNTSNTNKLLK